MAIGACAVVLFAFTAIYRFNTLGGAFAGFDNDHFMHFAYAKQVQAGERPLADFDDMALQGAWPYPVYRISAAAQERFGNSLRTEAVVTIAAVALAAALTMLTSAMVAPIAAAVLASAFTIIVAPTLYNYPKVLVLSAGAAAVVWYARSPGAVRVASLSAAAAVAFAFRHDLAVYLAVGTLAVLAAAARTWRDAVRHAFVYAGLTAAFMMPSLAYIHRHVGLVNHLRDSIEMSHSESARTRLDWPTFTLTDAGGVVLAPTTWLSVEQNAVAWLYYVIRVLPAFAVLLVWLTRAEHREPGRRAAVVALAAMLVLTSPILLRGNVAVRFGDIGPLYAPVLAATLGMALRRRTREAVTPWLVRVACSAAILVPTLAAVWTVGYLRTQLETAGLSVSPKAAADRTAAIWAELGTLPAGYWSAPNPTSFVGAVQYLNRCTSPEDRVLVMPYWPELLPLADRRFAGGRLSLLPGFRTTLEHQRRIVERWRQQQVPLVLVDEEPVYAAAYESGVPMVHAYLVERYELVGHLPLGDGVGARVFADRARLAGAGTDATGLPCLR